MDALERKILKGIAGNLRGSTRTDWSSGDLAKWAEYARLMKKTILESATLIDSLTDHQEEKPKEFKIE
jgi:hypothetical protein